MSRAERITITLPRELLDAVDQRESNRSRFVQEAVRHELDRRSRQELAESLAHPHPQSGGRLADGGLSEWPLGVADDELVGLIDPNAGEEVRWVEGVGWTRP